MLSWLKLQCLLPTADMHFMCYSNSHFPPSLHCASFFASSLLITQHGMHRAGKHICRDLSTALAGLQGQGPLVSLTLEVVNDRVASGAGASTSGREESIDTPPQGESSSQV